MARMINADELLERLSDLANWCLDNRKIGLEQAICMVHETPTITRPTGWISVKDRLPKTGTVLATDGRVVITAPASSVTADGPAITHWMPLPGLPGKDEIK